MSTATAPPRAEATAARRVAQLEPTRVAVALLTCTAVLGLLGALAFSGIHIRGAWLFDLDAEGRPPAIFSFALPAGVAGLAWLLAGTASGHERATWLAVGAFVGYMAVDELLALHEHLEGATGVDWQVLYAPLVAVGGVAWLGVLRLLGSYARRLWAAGAGAWLVAQVLEALQWNGDVEVRGYVYMATPEEILEMTGSALFLLALLIALRAAVAPRTGSATPAA